MLVTVLQSFALGSKVWSEQPVDKICDSFQRLALVTVFVGFKVL